MYWPSFDDYGTSMRRWLKRERVPGHPRWVWLSWRGSKTGRGLFWTPPWERASIARRYGYEIVTEEWQGITIRVGVTLRVRKYIGDTRQAYRLCVLRGIAPECLDDKQVCSIGFCKKDQKWYGWSHRAIFGFGIGSTIDSEDDLCARSGLTDGWLKEHPEDNTALPVGFTAKILDDARRMAAAFAEAVG